MVYLAKLLFILLFAREYHTKFIRDLYQKNQLRYGKPGKTHLLYKNRLNSINDISLRHDHHQKKVSGRKVSAGRYMSSARAGSTSNQFFKRQSVPASSVVEQSRIVNNYFSDNSWVDSLGAASSLSPVTQTNSAQTLPVQSAGRFVGLSNSAGTGYFSVPGSQQINSVSGIQQIQANPGIQITSGNQLEGPLVSSYSFYEPAAGDFIQDDSAKAGSLSKDNKVSIGKALGKFWLPSLLFSFITTGITFGGLAFAFSQNPPTLVSYSRRQWLPESIGNLLESHSNTGGLLDSFSNGALMRLWRKVHSISRRMSLGNITPTSQCWSKKLCRLLKFTFFKPNRPVGKLLRNLMKSGKSSLAFDCRKFRCHSKRARRI